MNKTDAVERLADFSTLCYTRGGDHERWGRGRE